MVAVVVVVVVVVVGFLLTLSSVSRFAGSFVVVVSLALLVDLFVDCFFVCWLVL